MKRLKWILILSTFVAVGCTVQVKEITKPAKVKTRVKKVSDKDNIEHYHVVMSRREGTEQVFLFMKVKRPVAPHMKSLKNAPKVEQIAFEGGLRGGGRHCDGSGPHGFLGIEDEVVRAIGNWIKANNPR